VGADQGYLGAYQAGGLELTMPLDLDSLFGSCELGAEETSRCEMVRTAAKNLAEVIARTVQPGSDQTEAIKRTREAATLALAGIILRGRDLGTAYRMVQPDRSPPRPPSRRGKNVRE